MVAPMRKPASVLRGTKIAGWPEIENANPWKPERGEARGHQGVHCLMTAEKLQQ
eukprot:CAMPEP_0115053746 /NCGR_PEP_ID=MMETSP0227-20121206/3694_1 /TAXON_ID=89957 /ORGANISM="Polarella glacialis, Strain CCMP 1383" /LENGTH=53 /DNA_ID=CAMNT_0002438113 /DNA_START=1919 /DNA_END=2080 /DNA_ORIENTATION=-